MKIRQQAEELWVETFGDDREFVHRFFSQYYREDTFFCVEQNGELQAMLFATPYTLRISHREYPASYLSAITTKTQYRKKGLAERLIKKTEDRLKSLGFDYLFLIAANEGLISYYERLGFGSVFSHRENIFLKEDFDFPQEGFFRLKEAEEMDFSLYQRLTSQRDNAVMHSLESLSLYRSGGYKFYSLEESENPIALAVCKFSLDGVQVLDLAGENTLAESQLLQMLSTRFSLPLTYSVRSFAPITSPQNSPYMLRRLFNTHLPFPNELYFNLLLDR